MATSRRWWISVAEAKAVRERLRHRVERTDRFEPLTRVVGVDVGVARGQRMVGAIEVVMGCATRYRVPSC